MIPSPGFALTEERRVPVIRSEPSTGFVLSRSLMPAGSPFQLRSFKLVWPLLTPATKSQLVTEFEATRGGAGTFTFTTPSDMGGETLNCRFASDTLSLDRVGNKTWSASIDVEVVRMVL